jgi:hypothetical protein
MRLIRILVAAAIVIAFPILSATAAHASLDGPCTGTGTINGIKYDPKIEDSITIPRKGDVHWEGTVTDGSGKRAINGEVYVELPWPISKVKFNGTWGKSSDSYENANVYHYDLPSVLVGPKFTVSGDHHERAINCFGTIDVYLKGSKLKNPILLASLVFTVIAIVNMSIVIRARKRVRT